MECLSVLAVSTSPVLGYYFEFVTMILVRLLYNSKQGGVRFQSYVPQLGQSDCEVLLFHFHLAFVIASIITASILSSSVVH